MWLFLLIFGLILFIKYFNKHYNLLGGCRRLKTVDGSPLETRITTIKGKTIFGNNFDLIGATPKSAFNYARNIVKEANGRDFTLNFLNTPVYGVATAEDAEEVLQSQALITKGVIYDIIKPFLGLGLLLNTGEQWQFRRKLMTPAFHFNILQTFSEVFKEESHKLIAELYKRVKENVALADVIPHFTLNSICETALGVKLDEIPGSEQYRKAVDDLQPILVNRSCNPLLYYRPIFWCTKEFWLQNKLVNITNGFASKIIKRKRSQFKEKINLMTANTVDEFGKKQRYAMLDTLLTAELEGHIDHQGICDEVTTFMFEGYDTTSTCLLFALLNLAEFADIQQKCYEEIRYLADIEELTVFDFNKLEYLECVIKETLRLYPSVPFLARKTVKETVVNGLILPAQTDIQIHVFDINRDEKHFPNPNKFDPERFKPENTTNRHPFAFISFSAGPRNCIGQKFAMLEIKVFLVAILKNFIVLPVTRLEDIELECGMLLRPDKKVEVKFMPRKQ